MQERSHFACSAEVNRPIHPRTLLALQIAIAGRLQLATVMNGIFLSGILFMLFISAGE